VGFSHPGNRQICHDALKREPVCHHDLITTHANGVYAIVRGNTRSKDIRRLKNAHRVGDDTSFGVIGFDQHIGLQFRKTKVEKRGIQIKPVPQNQIHKTRPQLATLAAAHGSMVALCRVFQSVLNRPLTGPTISKQLANKRPKPEDDADTQLARPQGAFAHPGLASQSVGIAQD
jgi:hypothetical protein